MHFSYKLQVDKKALKKNQLDSIIQPITFKNTHHFSRSASVRGTNKKNKSISYENNFYDMASSNGGQRRGPIWSKPHPHQSLSNAKISVSGPPEPPPRQPLQLANGITTMYDILPFFINFIMSQSSIYSKNRRLTPG